MLGYPFQGKQIKRFLKISTNHCAHRLWKLVIEQQIETLILIRSCDFHIIGIQFGGTNTFIQIPLDVLTHLSQL